MNSSGGGTDFSDKKNVEKLKCWLKEMVEKAQQLQQEYLQETGQELLLFIHLAPPCATFSKARDRCWRTRVRSQAQPAGIKPIPEKVRIANIIARQAILFARWAVDTLGATVTLENPFFSYLWIYGAPWMGSSKSYRDVRLNYCKFGMPYKKTTRFRVWNGDFGRLNQQCFTTKGSHSCGNAFHAHLEFGGVSTASAAAYPARLCEAYAECIEAMARTAAPAEGSEPSANDIRLAEAEVKPTRKGRVKRHTRRGPEQQSQKEQRTAEDEACAAGLRNPALHIDEYGGWIALMATIAPIIRQGIADDSRLSNLSSACGKNPLKAPPPPKAVAAIRAKVGAALGISRGECERQHKASEWRFVLIQKLLALSGDRDTFIGDWVQSGSPMGISSPIPPGGWFPTQAHGSDLSLDELSSSAHFRGNHPSFNELHGEEEAPAVGLVQKHIDAGFGMLFESKEDAERYLGQECFPAPLGNVAKEKDDGSFKHRLIQDLKANLVNRTSHVPERAVSPRPLDHALDLAFCAAMAAGNMMVATLIIDFRNAFMTMALHESELPYNCCEVKQGLSRNRKPLYEGEPHSGTFVVWRVLGFGGRPNPLLFARLSSMAMRSVQCLVNALVGSAGFFRSQLYVDDPALCIAGDKSTVSLATDATLVWWLILGLPLAWDKGAFYETAATHIWIGVLFTLLPSWDVAMELPELYLKELYALLEPLSAGKGTVSLKIAERTVGKAGRVSHIVPEARPFTGALYAAFSGATKADAEGPREAPPGEAACRRFKTAATWIRLMIAGTSSDFFPLRRVVSNTPPAEATLNGWVIQFDASIWGGGAILKHGDIVKQFWYCSWATKDVARLGVQANKPKHQTFWETLVVLMSLMVWGDRSADAPVLIVGDNTAALQNTLDLKGKDALLSIAREVAWRKARYNWRFSVAHLPSEFNSAPDALSRQFGPSPKPWPAEALGDAEEVVPPSVGMLWKF